MLHGISAKYEGGQRVGDKKKTHAGEFLSLRDIRGEEKGGGGGAESN